MELGLDERRPRDIDRKELRTHAPDDLRTIISAALFAGSGAVAGDPASRLSHALRS